MLYSYLLKIRHLTKFRFQFNNILNFIVHKGFSNFQMNSKPPNILVYTGNTSNLQRFKEVEESILTCLRPDNYLVYHLLETEVNKTPWMENSLLLVVSSDVIGSNVVEAFETYLKNFGNVLFICSKFDNYLFGGKCFQMCDENNLILVDFTDTRNVCVCRGKYSYDFKGSVLCRDGSNKSVIQKITRNENILIASEIYLDRDSVIPCESSEYNKENRLSMLKYILTEAFGLEANTDYNLPEISPGYFICDMKYQMLDLLKNLNLSDISSKSVFHECKFTTPDKTVKMPIYFCNENSLKPFNFKETLYFSNLHTEKYGHQFVYFPVITSTMDAAEQLLEYEGIVIASGYQISGKGRGTNKWISPEGCAMFTLNFTVPLNSNIGKRLTLLQHIASLAVVRGIKSKKIYECLQLKIKWPNDIYIDKTKICGLIAKTVIQNDLAHVSIGWGINVANSQPTSCLNDAIDKYNLENSSLPHLCVEEVMAFTVSQMEYFVKDFMQFGPENFIKNYYIHWMHNGQEVSVTNLNQKGKVIGIDEFGFLKIKIDNGETLILHPDGNRFDIMKNLIYSVK